MESELEPRPDHVGPLGRIKASGFYSQPLRDFEQSGTIGHIFTGRSDAAVSTDCTRQAQKQEFNAEDLQYSRGQRELAWLKLVGVQVVRSGWILDDFKSRAGAGVGPSEIPVSHSRVPGFDVQL